MAAESPTSRTFPSHFKSQQDQELIRRALHQSAFFTSLDDEQVDRFVKVAVRKNYEASKIVFLEGVVDDDDEEEEQTNKSVEEEKVNSRDAAEGLVEPDDYLLDHEKEDSVRDDKNDIGEEQIGAPEASLEAVKKVDTSGVSSRKEEELNQEIEKLIEEEKALVVSESTELSDKENNGQDDLTIELQESLSKLDTMTDSSQPPPPRSGIKRSIYIIRQGHADVLYLIPHKQHHHMSSDASTVRLYNAQQPHFRPASLGPGTLFGEGGFLFGRQHSASVVAREPLECWIVEFDAFRKHVLPSDSMQQLFETYASQEDENGVAYMTLDDFVNACRQSTSWQDPLVVGIANMYNLLQHSSSSSSSSLQPQNRIYLQDFCFFHFIVARPDPEVDIAFLLMDQRRTGQVYLDDVRKFVEPLGLDLSTQFFERYFGKDANQSIRQVHFSQFLVDLQREVGKQAFIKAAREQGYLEPTEFVHILKTACGWRLPKGVADRLEAIYDHVQENDATSQVGSSAEDSKGGLDLQYFAYGDFLAFQEVLGNLPGICSLIDRAEEIKKGPISPDDFKVANRVMGGRLSRRQVEIVFALFDLDRDGFISHNDTIEVCGADFCQRLVASPERGGKLTIVSPSEYSNEKKPTERDSDTLKQVIRFLEHLGLTAVASSLGVFLLYPLDTAKTMIMNDQVKLGTQGRYKGWVDCVQKILRFEGPRGLYRGLTPQLLGVAPERIIKLQVYDLLRQGYFSSIDSDVNESNGRRRRIQLPFEVLAGACAGACQLLVTNPMEISKIRMQLQGETSRIMKSRGFPPPKTQSFISVVRELGFPGVYRGASACLLRDVPFSAIYFPTYAACKELLVAQKGDSLQERATVSDLLIAGTLAAVPAALFTTPADVIKTRLQSVPRPGEFQYNGIRDCALEMYRREGWQAFFRGALPRVLRIAPQFGISLLGYEQLTRWFGLNHGGENQNAIRPPTHAPIHPQDYRDAFLLRSVDVDQPKP